MTRPRDGAHRLVGETFVREIGLVVRFEEPPDHDVELALREPLEQHVARLHEKMHTQVGMLARDDGHCLRQQAQCGTGDRTNAHFAEAPRLQRFELAARLRKTRQRDARVPDHRLAIPRGSHAARQSLEQRDAEHVLEILEKLRGRGLRHVEELGRAMNVALIANRDQQHELPRLESGTEKPGHAVRHGGILSRYANQYIDSARIRICSVSL
jgi:hypothetical protein